MRFLLLLIAFVAPLASGAQAENVRLLAELQFELWIGDAPVILPAR